MSPVRNKNVPFFKSLNIQNNWNLKNYFIAIYYRWFYWDFSKSHVLDHSDCIKKSKKSKKRLWGWLWNFADMSGCRNQSFLRLPWFEFFLDFGFEAVCDELQGGVHPGGRQDQRPGGRGHQPRRIRNTLHNKIL